MEEGRSLKANAECPPKEGGLFLEKRRLFAGGVDDGEGFEGNGLVGGVGDGDFELDW